MKKRFPLTPLQIVCEVLCIVLTILPFILLPLFWHKIPARIPTHFGISDVPDAWGSRENLWFVPCMAAGLYVLITLLTCISPYKWNVPEGVTDENRGEFVRIMRWMMIFVKLCMLCIMAWTLWSQVHAQAEGIWWSLPVNIGVLFGGIILFLVYTHKKFGPKSSDI